MTDRSRCTISKLSRAKLSLVSEVVSLTAAEAGTAGALLADRHARERARFPILPAAYEDPSTATELVQSTLSFCDGVGALDDGDELVGFLTSFDSTPDPTSPMARYCAATIVACTSSTDTLSRQTSTPVRSMPPCSANSPRGPSIAE